MATFLGNPVTFTGSQLQVGDTAHDFSLITPALEKKSLADFAGKKKVLSIIPSIDTGICSMQTRHFNQTLSDMEDTVVSTFLLLKVNGALLKDSTMPSCSQTTTTIPSGKHTAS